MSKRDRQWVIRFDGGRFLKHPRGEFTSDKNEAYGYAYKKDAERENEKRIDWSWNHNRGVVMRRGDCAVKS